jgi:hypothetical protein
MRKWATVIAIAVALSATAWTGAWFFIAQKTGDAIDKWIEDEKSRDRFWACAGKRTEGFPFQLNLRCDSPTFASPTGPVQTGAAQRLLAEASVTSPFHINFKIEGPLKLTTRSGAAAIRWDAFNGSVKTRTATPDISMNAKGLVVEEASADLSAWARTRTSEVAIRIQPSPDRAPGSDVQLVTTSIDGMSAAPLDTLLGSADPFRTSLSALVMNAGSANSGTFAERLDRWTESGGRVQIGSLTAEKGASRLEANGDLALDERRRPSGKLSVRMVGVQPLLARLNLPSAPLAIEGLLRGTGNRGGASLLENRTLPLEMRAGRLYIGPLRTPIVMPPLI